MMDTTEKSCQSSNTTTSSSRNNKHCAHHLYLRSHDDEGPAGTANGDVDVERGLMSRFISSPAATNTATSNSNANTADAANATNNATNTASNTATTSASDCTETSADLPPIVTTASSSSNANSCSEPITQSSPWFSRSRSKTRDCHSRNNSTSSGSDNTIRGSKRRSSPASATHEQTHKVTIFLVSLLVFAICAGAGLAVFFVMKNSSDTAANNDALEMAAEMGHWFSKELDLAIMPLFSMAQFATELTPFVALPEQIGDPNHDKNALPFLPNPPPVKRNITGVCDQPDLVHRYNQIAASVKTNSHMDGVLHNIQLSPQGVVCLAYPLNNTEDFQNGTYLDSSGAIGLDLLHEPTHMYIARKSLVLGEVGVAGPMTLLQCPTCGLYFIVRLPIHSDSHEIDIDGQWYPRWGFATALISWDALVGRSQVQERFQSRGYAFQLTRTDYNLNAATQLYETHVVVLAKSEDFQGYDDGDHHQVSTALQTTNNEWVMSVRYQDSSPWVSVLAISASLVVAFFMAGLVYLVLMQRQTHTVMRGVTMTQEATVELERHMTAYFAHELRNPLSAIDSALAILQDKYEQRNQPRHLLGQGSTAADSSNSDDEDDETAELVAGMQLCSSFMSSIMDNLLDSRKLQENMMVLKNNPLSLATLLEDVHKMMAPAVRPGVDLLIECNTTTAATTTTTTRRGSLDNRRGDYVFGDAHRLQQILTNVVSNAVKHTRTGSITLVAGWEGDLVRLECRDTGPGIPKEEQEHMFQKFTTRGGAPGTGLGLSIAKQIVDLIGGSIRFESDPTVKPGTNCVILLPLKPCEEPMSNSARHIEVTPMTMEQYPARKKVQDSTDFNVDASRAGSASTTGPQELFLDEPLSILITDDIKMNRVMLKRRMQKCIAPNCTIQEAATGEETLQICAEQSFDIIIMDQYMEQAGGLLLGTDVIIALRRSKAKSLIIGCSGNSLEDQFRAAGANIVWKKPIPSNSEIIRQLRQFLALQETTG